MKLSRLNTVLAASLVTLAIAAVPASAAPGPALPLVGGPDGISAGVFIPSSGDAKNAGGSTQLAVTFNYTLPVPNPLDVPARTVIGLGVETGSKSGKHSTIIPLTIGERFSAKGTSPSGGGVPYFGVGVGAYFMNQSGISSSARIGGYGEVGYNITHGLFVEGKYQFVEHGNGFVLNAGLRF